MIRKGKTTARGVACAHVLLRAAEGAADEEITETLHLGLSTVHRTRQRFVDEGLTAALSERSQSGSLPVLTGRQAVFLVALSCSTPPAGRQRWTMKLLADRFVELRQIDTISLFGGGVARRPGGHLPVLSHPELLLTNAAECALRHRVILRKLSLGTRTPVGSRVVALLASVILPASAPSLPQATGSSSEKS